MRKRRSDSLCGFARYGRKDWIEKGTRRCVLYVRGSTMESLERRIGQRRDATGAPTQAPEWLSRGRNPGQSRTGKPGSQPGWQRRRAEARSWLRTGPLSGGPEIEIPGEAVARQIRRRELSILQDDVVPIECN